MSSDLRSQLGLLERIHEFAVAGASDELTPDHWAQFEQLLWENENACRLYFEYVEETDFLQTILESMPEEDFSSPNVFSLEPTDSVSAPAFAFPATSFHSAIDYFSSGWPMAYLLATVIFGVGLVIGLLTHVSQPVQTAETSRSATEPELRQKPELIAVGRITGMADCKWKDPKTAPADNAHVPLGQKYALASGLMEITYDTGAKVILQGPVVYKVESQNSGFLSVGRLTGKVNVEAAKGFSVHTPAATITDLGTEFGVEVDKQGTVKAHVFRGSIEVQATSRAGTSEGDVKVLRKNEAIRVESGGAMTILAVSPQNNEFVRQLPGQTVKTLDLVDVVAGGDGYSGRRNRGIDPTTGRTVDTPPERKVLVGDGRYHRVEGLSLVDGVFIPNSGRGSPVQTDSAGHTFDAFGTAFHETWHCVWAGSAIPTGVPGQAISTVLGGVDYNSPGHGLLYMHANKGITFDLDAIRRANPGYKLVRFHTVVGNTETAAGLAFHGNTGAKTILFSDDFQSAALGTLSGSRAVGTWELHDGADASVQVQNNVSPGNPKSDAGANKYLAFTRKAPNDASFILATGWSALSTEQQIVQLNLSLYVPSGPATDCFGITAFTNGSDASGRTISILQYRNGDVKFHDGREWKATTLKGKADVWQNLVITADMAAKKYTIRLDDGVYNDAYWQGGATTVGCLYMSRPVGTAGGKAFVDNLCLQTSPTPSTPEKISSLSASADVWIIVDGERRSGRRGIKRDSGANSIVISISERDRFLTLAATDGGNGFYQDSILFGDPLLELRRTTGMGQ